MNRIRSVLLCGAVVLITCAWMAVGLYLIFDAIPRHNHPEFYVGLSMVFPTSIGVVGVASLLIDRFVPGEHERGRQHLERTRPSRRKYLLRRQERSIKRLKFLQRHPSAGLAFILVALLVCTAMLFAPATAHYPENAYALHVLGGVLCFGYVMMLASWLYLVITRRWESTIDRSIRLLEEKQANVRERLAERDASSRL